MDPETRTNFYPILLPSERFAFYSEPTDSIVLFPSIRAEDITMNPQKSKIAIAESKTVRVFEISSDMELAFKQPPSLESVFTKKVEGVTFDLDGKVVVSDKFGDIYEATSENPRFLNSNLGIPTFLKHVQNHNDNREYIVLGDDYCKIKLYNYNNMHEVSGIWYVPNSIPLDLVRVDGERFALLMKHEDKDNTRHNYELYQFGAENLSRGDFHGQSVWKGPQETLSTSQYHPCCVTVSTVGDESWLHFLRLYENSVQLLSFTGKGQLKESSKRTLKLPQAVPGANSIQASFVGPQKLLVSLGQFYSWEASEESKLSPHAQKFPFSQSETADGLQTIKLNDKEFVIKWSLD